VGRGDGMTDPPFSAGGDGTKPALLARLILAGFIAIFAFATAYLLLEEFGIWPRLPARLTHGLEILAGLVLLLTLVSHLILALGPIPTGDSTTERR